MRHEHEREVEVVSSKRCRHPQGGRGGVTIRATPISLYRPPSQIPPNKRSCPIPHKGKPVLTTEQITKLYDNYINTAIGTWDDILEKLRDDPEFSQLVEEGNYIEVVLEVLSPC